SLNPHHSFVSWIWTGSKRRVCFSSLAAVKSEGIRQESDAILAEFSSLAAVKSEGIGQESGRSFGSSLVARDIHTIRDLSRGRKTFESGAGWISPVFLFGK
ncbi:hypothetical protein M5D96_012566, partial [Drosophila gunungcola]